MSREIAILIDGGFFSKRLPKLVSEQHRTTPANVVGSIRFMCHRHVEKLTGDPDPNWHKHVYRIFYYDAYPFEGQAHHPLTNRQIDFGKSDRATFQHELFDLLKKQRNVALRLGKVNRVGGWNLSGNRLQRLLATQAALDGIDLDHTLADGSLNLTGVQVEEVLDDGGPCIRVSEAAMVLWSDSSRRRMPLERLCHKATAAPSTSHLSRLRCLRLKARWAAKSLLSVELETGGVRYGLVHRTGTH